MRYLNVTYGHFLKSFRSVISLLATTVFALLIIHKYPDLTTKSSEQYAYVKKLTIIAVVLNRFSKGVKSI